MKIGVLFVNNAAPGVKSFPKQELVEQRGVIVGKGPERRSRAEGCVDGGRGGKILGSIKVKVLNVAP